MSFGLSPNAAWEKAAQVKRTATPPCPPATLLDLHLALPLKRRVNAHNRLRRAKVPREAAMRLVNHASELIHQIYQREKVEDVAQWRDAV